MIAVLIVVAGCGDRSTSTLASASPNERATLLIAPFIEGQSFCDEALADRTIKDEDGAAALCDSLGKSGARGINALLDAIGPKVNKSGTYRLGYTLNLPVFRFYRRQQADWVFDKKALADALHEIAEIDRPVVIFLSSDHFAISNEALTADLVADPRDLMSARGGVMAIGGYFNNPIVPWTLVDQSAKAETMRTAAFKAVVEGICQMPEDIRIRIAAVSVLGEVHQMFPNLEAGPRFDIPMYESSDYSATSVRGFRTWLSQKYGDIAHLNHDVAGDFASFDIIEPPSRDIHTEMLSSFFDHIDASAAGRMAVYGWVHDQRHRAVTVQVLVDGKFLASARTGLNRTDVTAAIPTILNPNVGFRLDLDFRALPYGFHHLDVLVDRGSGPSLLLASQKFLIGDRHQGPGVEIPYVPPVSQDRSEDQDITGGLDGPAPMVSVYYNPMADLWLQYRNQVVRAYITRYASLVQGSCIPGSKIFSHQLAQGLYGSWNTELLAADASEMPSPAYNQGTTLYGGTAFGTAFFEMKNRLGWSRYAVGEMHPLASLTPAQYRAMFEAHRMGGAVYVAPYYMSTRRETPEDTTVAKFLISPRNPSNASDRYYRAIKELMAQ